MNPWIWPLAFIAAIVLAWLAAWLYGRRWPKPKARARITKVNTYGCDWWQVEVFDGHGYPVHRPAVTHWVRWSDALRYATERIARERAR